METDIKPGDFSLLAQHYHHRAGYSQQLLEILKALINKSNLCIADVGAGTGKLTSQLWTLDPYSLVAVEPNDAMREEGKKYTAGTLIDWRQGTAEHTGLANAELDWVLMGSSFHWVELEAALKEFHRILRPHGIFTAVWNPRDLERSELQLVIDAKIKELVPDLKRVSSGSPRSSQDWSSKLLTTGHFRDAIFMESRHVEHMSKERYMGIWNSVNDIQAQAGPQRWKKILEMIANEIGGLNEIQAPYLTRAWTVWRID